jgi:hypothetical protein
MRLVERICPQCGKNFYVEQKRINAGQGINCSRKCASKSRYTGGRAASVKRCRIKFKEKHLKYNLEYNKKYRKTIKGYLTLIFHKMVMRCTDPHYQGYRWYGGRGIKCKFESSKEFVDYVINELKVDPRGLDCDRIDGNGHYEKGNIQFITHRENIRKVGQ